MLAKRAAADRKHVEAQHDVAFAYEQMGQALFHLKPWDEAKKAIDRAIAIRERLVAADPNNREDVSGLVELRTIRRAADTAQRQ